MIGPMHKNGPVKENKIETYKRNRTGNGTEAEKWRNQAMNNGKTRSLNTEAGVENDKETRCTNQRRYGTAVAEGKQEIEGGRIITQRELIQKEL